ncbi:MAG: leucyl aminopeptidase, partial [Pseudomonadota bacterium]
MLNISFEEKDLFVNDAIAVLVNDQLKIDKDLMATDQKFHGLISKTIQNENKFKGKLGQVVVLSSTDKDGNAKT